MNQSTNHFINQHFFNYKPWFSFIYSIICFYILACNLQINLAFHQEITSILYQPMHLLWLMICALLIYLFDYLVISRKSKDAELAFRSLNAQLEKSREQKNKQQLRANTYFDHSDKLKNFISDKLIEYMDFDEKFIHFKGIAAEVRHNGVISYDKVSTALNRAIEQQGFLTIFEQANKTDEEENNGNESITSTSLYDYQSAKEAISYLWDLLDLSTAENMSLYIGKKLVDYEENYFQIKLNENGTEHSTPCNQPTFFALQSLLMSLKLFSQSEKIKHQLINSNINTQLYTEAFQFKDEQFEVNADVTGELLGNPNHIVLLLENLLKNAQFFNNKNKFKQKSDRIRIHLKQINLEDHSSKENEDDLEEQENGVLMTIYNRGQNIDDEDIDKIFKLGYSTRRKKNYNGRGLGLYFVNEIVKGYQGTINAVNINCKVTNFSILIGLASHEEFIYQTKNKLIDGQMKTISTTSIHIDEAEQLNWQSELKVEKDIPIKTIQIKNADSSQIYTATEKSLNNLKEKLVLTDPLSNLPLWEISLTPYKKKQVFTFKALDITGVRFDVKIPSVIE